MSISLALRDMLPLGLVILALVFFYIPSEVRRHLWDPPVPASTRIVKMMIWGMLSFVACAVCFSASFSLAVIMFYSTPGWHPLQALWTLTIGLCEGCTAIRG